MDGMGGTTSSTSKAILVGKSTVPNHDVDYYFGQVAIDKRFYGLEWKLWKFKFSSWTFYYS